MTHPTKHSRTETDSASAKHVQTRPIQAYIPSYLRQIVVPCHEDFCYTPHFHPQLITQLMAEGFLPIAHEGLLLPKLHRERSCINLPDGLRVHKSVRKKAKRFQLTINQAFDQVIDGCERQHAHCWLVNPLVDAFRIMHTSIDNQATLVTGTTCPVPLYSIEVWNNSGELVGGELGYSVGSIYTSLTGFCSQDSAGSVQLATLGRLLSQNGFTIWDLGMDMDYKRDLGTHLVPRDEFLALLHHARETGGQIRLPVIEKTNCRLIMTGQVKQHSCVK